VHGQEFFTQLRNGSRLCEQTGAGTSTNAAVYASLLCDLIEHAFPVAGVETLCDFGVSVTLLSPALWRVFVSEI
jgi:hypothetical protein